MSTLIHIGYPKCASTFLKRSYLSRITSELVVPRGDLLASILSKDCDLRKIKGLLEVDGLHCGLENTVFTNEALSGASFWSNEGAFEAAKALYELQPMANILIIIREQRDYIESAYKYSICHGQHLKVYRRHISDNLSALTQKLSYNMLVEEYIRLFGKSQVLVLPVEMLRRDKSKFVDKLNKFHKSTSHDQAISFQDKNPAVKANISPSNWRYIETVRRLNFLLQYVYKIEMQYIKPRHYRLRDEKFSVYKELISVLEKAYAGGSNTRPNQYLGAFFFNEIETSNRLTEQHIGIDLKEFGYL